MRRGAADGAHVAEPRVAERRRLRRGVLPERGDDEAGLARRRLGRRRDAAAGEGPRAREVEDDRPGRVVRERRPVCGRRARRCVPEVEAPGAPHAVGAGRERAALPEDVEQPFLLAGERRGAGLGLGLREHGGVDAREGDALEVHQLAQLLRREARLARPAPADDRDVLDVAPPERVHDVCRQPVRLEARRVREQDARNVERDVAVADDRDVFREGLRDVVAHQFRAWAGMVGVPIDDVKGRDDLPVDGRKSGVQVGHWRTGGNQEMGVALEERVECDDICMHWVRVCEVATFTSQKSLVIPRRKNTMG